ncbi:MAG: peptidoglycan DD-metalloendopeptidase family protein [Porticoccus sp.]|nr:peptidoglycan DD-metalloendopeptidase family protein [Porticoccus sp.]
MSQASYSRPSKTPRIWQRLLSAPRPKTPILVMSALAITLILALTIPSKEVSAKRSEEQITLRFQNADVQTPENNPFSDIKASTPIKTEVNPAVLPTNTDTSLTWKNQPVRSGDNLSTIFQRASLGARDVHKLMSSSPLTKPLLDMRPGQEIQFGFNTEGKLSQLKYIKTKLESYVYTSTEQETGAGYSGKHIVLEPELMTTYRESTIEDSLFLSGERAQLPHGLIMELSNIFGWDIDFALDIRKGDRFSLTYEEKFLDGEKIGNGNILAAEFTNQGKSFKAVRYEDGNGNANYYTPEGFSMRKAFLRAPLDFTRISSGFNLRRKHPIHKKIRAHRGVDYAAPRGTPIFAAGDGKVIGSGYSKANGNYVFIQHGQRFTTKYLHLTKRTVKKGQTVKQRQVIGTLGSTGYATGPHLHYEFLVNGVHRNPRTVTLPQATPIKEQERAKFDQHTRPLIAQLTNYQQISQLAMATTKETQTSTH